MKPDFDSIQPKRPPTKKEAADRIEALEARLAKADALISVVEATMIADDIPHPILLAMINYDNDCIRRTPNMGKSETMKKHADAMLRVSAGYSYPPNLAEDLYFHIKKLEDELQKQISYKNDYKAVNEGLRSEQETTRKDTLMEVANIARKYIYYDSSGIGFNEDDFEEEIRDLIGEEE
jgi:hypothetical protein